MGLLLKKEEVSVLSILWPPSTMLGTGLFTCGISLSLGQLQTLGLSAPTARCLICSKQPIEPYMAALFADVAS